jgi:hypothetical protein
MLLKLRKLRVRLATLQYDSNFSCVEYLINEPNDLILHRLFAHSFRMYDKFPLP